ncbi:hypothetical protein [Streptomyces noursei]|uniref:hypothetical protein n=1 Tax=Streptomyces noursei TaxID=1971 RepID=UPI00167BCA94|nr:hypothetical protein [Streptomyces noursei]MCZ1018988.1 hypothetical protein [Streptomyces noursei]
MKQSLGLGDGQRDRAAVGWRVLVGIVGQDGGGVAGLVDGREYGEQGEGRHGHGDVAFPRPVASDLGLVE